MGDGGRMNHGYCRYGHDILLRSRCRYGHVSEDVVDAIAREFVFGDERKAAKSFVKLLMKKKGE